MKSASRDEGVNTFSVSGTVPFFFTLNINNKKNLLFLFLIDSLRVYTPPDPPGYFDGHVWPMYLKNRSEMESMASGISECPSKGELSEQLWYLCG